MTNKIIFLLGLSAIVMGWFISGVELYHVTAGQHKLEVLPFIISAFFMTSGGIVIQTGSVLKVAQLLMSVIPGGRRKYDPPISSEYKVSDTVSPKKRED